VLKIPELKSSPPCLKIGHCRTTPYLIKVGSEKFEVEKNIEFTNSLPDFTFE
jgi:hypothetical protein